MKKIILSLILAFGCLSSFSQNKILLSDISSLYFYGIDFSLVKVLGGNDPVHKYWLNFNDINEYFISKPKTYDVGKRLGIPVEVTSLQAVNQVNHSVNPDLLMTSDANYAPTKEQIEKAIQDLPILSKEEHNGLVMIATLLNNKEDRGTYQFVVFNTKTRKIIDQWTHSGKAIGLSLKSYWGMSVLNAIRKMK